MSQPLLDSLGQPLEEGDFVVYAAGSRTAGPSGRIGRVIATKAKVRVQFYKADGTPREAVQYTPGGKAYFGPEWLAPESLVVVTALKTWRPA